MKRFIALLLVFVMVASLAACKKKEEPVVTEPPVTEAPTEPVVERPTEVVPEIEIETLPPVIPDDVEGLELRAMYKNFLQNYDWSQHNGFQSKIETKSFTYIFGPDGEYRDTKLMSEVYPDSYVARKVYMNKGGAISEFILTDVGAFGRTRTTEMTTLPEQVFAFINKTTTAEYSKTVIEKEVYDVITFYTQLTETDFLAGSKIDEEEKVKPTAYLVQNANNPSEILTVLNKDGKWMVPGVQAGENEISFDPDTGVLVLPTREIKVNILPSDAEPEEDEASEGYDVEYIYQIRGDAYVNRKTHKVEYIKDLDRNTTVYLLTDAVIDFTIPENTNMEEWTGNNINLNYSEAVFAHDMQRYLAAK